MTESMAKAERKAKKRNFTQCEVEVLVGEVEKRKAVLFGGYSAGVANAKKAQEWQHVADNVNAVTSEGRSVAEVKKKWCDIKVDAKKAPGVTQAEHLCHGRGNGPTRAHPAG